MSLESIIVTIERVDISRYPLHLEQLALTGMLTELVKDRKRDDLRQLEDWNGLRYRK
jgi:hypothetical protein